jgi:hypothetical protein
MPVFFGVVLGGFFCVVLRFQMMPMRHMSVMTGLLVFARFLVIRGSPMVLRGMLQVLCCLAMMFSAFFRHGISFRPQPSLAGPDYDQTTAPFRSSIRAAETHFIVLQNPARYGRRLATDIEGESLGYPRFRLVALESR